MIVLEFQGEFEFVPDEEQRKPKEEENQKQTQVFGVKSVTEEERNDLLNDVDY